MPRSAAASRGINPGLSYQATVPNLSYLVTLKFADPENAAPGQRVFGITINGTTVLPSVDVVANAGGQFKPWDSPPIPVTVTNGQINIGFTNITNNRTGPPIVNAIEIVEAGSVEVVPYTANLAEKQTLQFNAFTPGLAPGVTWSIIPQGLGSISPTTGLYTAPAVVTPGQTVTVIATSTANPSVTATSVITLLPIDPEYHVRRCASTPAVPLIPTPPTASGRPIPAVP